MKKTGFLLFAFCGLLVPRLFAEVPVAVNFQGRLVDGTNLFMGPAGIVLEVYAAETGGAPLYVDSNSVLVVDGIYSTFLGDDDTGPGTLEDALAGAEAWVQVVVDGTVLAPRHRLVSAPYALHALDSEQLAGLPAAHYATGTPLYVFTETDPLFSASVASAISAANTSQWSQAYGWGDHAGEGYLTSETDPVYSADKANIATGTPLYVESDPLAVLADGTRAMTGDLDMGGHSITNVADGSIQFADGTTLSSAGVANWNTALSAFALASNQPPLPRVQVWADASTTYYARAGSGELAMTNTSFSALMNFIFTNAAVMGCEIELANTTLADGSVRRYYIDAPIYVSGTNATALFGMGMPQISIAEGYTGRLFVYGEPARVGDWSTIRGIWCTPGPDPGADAANTNSFFDFSNAGKVLVEDCTFYNLKGKAVEVGRNAVLMIAVDIKNNKFYSSQNVHPMIELTAPGGATAIWGGSVKDNFFIALSNAPCVEISSGHVRYINIANNAIYKQGYYNGTGIVVRSGYGHTIQGNSFITFGPAGKPLVIDSASSNMFSTLVSDNNFSWTTSTNAIFVGPDSHGVSIFGNDLVAGGGGINVAGPNTGGHVMQGYGVTSSNAYRGDWGAFVSNLAAAAYGWGDHSAEGYLTSETDPVWTAEKSSYATGTPIYVETDPNAVLADGSRAMSGDLDMGNHSITNVKTNTIVFTDGSHAVRSSGDTISGDMVVQGSLTLGGEARATWPVDASTTNLDMGGHGATNAGFIGFSMDIGSGAWTGSVPALYYKTNTLVRSAPDSYTRLLLHMDEPDKSTNFVDHSASNWALRTVGDASHSTFDSRFGPACAYFDGVGDCIRVTNNISEAFNFGTNDFTVEMFVIAQAGQCCIFDKGYVSSGVCAYDDGSGNLRFRIGGGELVAVYNIANGAWNHLAFTRDSGTARMFVNGRLLAESAGFTTSISNHYYFALGRRDYASDLHLVGYMDEVRVSVGIARYTANFSPPIAAFNTTGTVAGLYFNDGVSEKRVHLVDP